MKVLVTGATGFLGKHLVSRLQQNGCEVTAIGRNQAIGKQLAAAGVKFVRRNLCDREGIIDDCQGQDCIFHCGALSAPWGDEKEFYDINVIGTKNIIAGCQTHGVGRLIHVSTSAVYFDYRDRSNIPEDLPLPNPVNAYARSKQLAEAEIFAASKSAGLPAIIIRPRGIFGCGDTAILPRLMSANRKLGIPLINGGKAIVDITHVDNVVDALLLCQQAPDRYLGRVFNITNGEPIAVRDLLSKLFNKLGEPCRLLPISRPIADRVAVSMEAIAKTVLKGKEPLFTRYTVGLLAYSQTLDITAAVRDLGYQPRVTIDRGLEIFARWYRDNN